MTMCVPKYVTKNKTFKHLGTKRESTFVLCIDRCNVGWARRGNLLESGWDYENTISALSTYTDIDVMGPCSVEDSPNSVHRQRLLERGSTR